MTIQALAEKGQNHCEIARTLGVTEGAVRYRLRRLEEGARDGRKDKACQAEPYGEVIHHWVLTHEAGDCGGRPVNVRELHDHLVDAVVNHLPREKGGRGSGRSWTVSSVVR